MLSSGRGKAGEIRNELVFSAWGADRGDIEFSQCNISIDGGKAALGISTYGSARLSREPHAHALLEGLSRQH
jgi:hypothetical protein